MDTVFAFIQPFVEFSITYYWTGAILIFAICITASLTLIQLEHTKPPKYFPHSDDFFYVSVATLLLAFLWPFLLAVVGVVLVVVLYYNFIGFIVKMILKRTSK